MSGILFQENITPVFISAGRDAITTPAEKKSSTGMVAGNQATEGEKSFRANVALNRHDDIDSSEKFILKDTQACLAAINNIRLSLGKNQNKAGKLLTLLREPPLHADDKNRADQRIKSRLAQLNFDDHSPDLQVSLTRLQAMLSHTQRGAALSNEIGQQANQCLSASATQLYQALTIALLSGEKPGKTAALAAGTTAEPVPAFFLPDDLRRQLDLMTSQLEQPASGWELWDKILECIRSLNEDYLNVYQQVVQAYTTLYGVISDFKSEIYKYMSVDDKGNVKWDKVIDGKDFEDAIAEFKSKLRGDAGQIYPPAGSEIKLTTEQAEKWKDELGLENVFVVQKGNGEAVLMVDVNKGALGEIFKNLPDKNSEMNSAAYQAWLVGFEAQIDKVKSSLSLLMQKLSNANSTYDQTMKIYSGIVSSISNAWQSILQNMII